MYPFALVFQPYNGDASLAALENGDLAVVSYSLKVSAQGQAHFEP